ncbi:MAG: hypothetical protein ACRDHZ_13060 [Ktedonobacteraceae bacterium]
MSIALLGGPLDGAIREGLSQMPIYLVAMNLEDRPIYKRIACLKCSHRPVPYLFIGYENSIEQECTNASYDAAI